MPVRTEFWTSRQTFILAAIGAAIGIGNVWRFPFIAYSNGGGAFLIPYVIALITAGIPLLMLEFGLGFMAKAGAPIGFRNVIGQKYEWIGWLAVILGFGIIIYYCIILAWAVDYIYFSLNLAYAGDTEAFFFGTFLNLSDTVIPLGSINWLIVIGSVAAWIWIFIAIVRGIRSVERMVYVTVLVPWIIIAIFVIRGITLPGAWNGIAYYIIPDFSVLLYPRVWLAAYGQVFFTLSVGWGVMIAYASFLPATADLAKNAVIIAVANSLTSFIAGFAVFSTIGYLADQAGVAVTEVVRGGIELTFVTYPAAIQLLPIAPALFGILFFLMILTLGIDSAFATIEAASIPIIEEFNVARLKVITSLCILGLASGLVYTTNAGYHWLTIMDHYLSTVLLVVVGFLEAAAVAYVYGPERFRSFIAAHSEIRVGGSWNFSIKFLIPAVLLIILFTLILESLESPFGGYPSFANGIGWLVVVSLPVLSILLARTIQRRGNFLDENIKGQL